MNVIADQLKMLLEAGISVKLLLHEYCDTSGAYDIFLDKRIEWRFFRNSINGKRLVLYNYKLETKIHEKFYMEADFISDDLVEKLSDIDVCILHDIFYQGSYLVFNIALRKAQKKLPNVKFISFTHSIPCFTPKGGTEWPFSGYSTSMPNTTYVSLSNSGIPVIAETYKIPQSEVFIINNCLDPMQFMCTEVKGISRKFDFLSSDIFIIYPARLIGLKRHDNVSALAGTLKTVSKKNIKLMFCDSLTNEINNNEIAEKYKNFIRSVGVSFGLDNSDMVFTSDLGYINGLPRTAILDFFSLSNLLIIPSITESFSLIMLEAACRGNYLVLNSNVPVFQEISKELNAFLLNWEEAYGGDIVNTENFARAKAYLEGKARIIIRNMDMESIIHNKTHIRKRYSLQWIWNNQLKKLLNIINEGV